jgi:hypothetical protein
MFRRKLSSPSSRLKSKPSKKQSASLPKMSGYFRTTQRYYPEDHTLTTVRCSNPTTDDYVRFAVLTAMVMKSTVFWDITPCSPSQKIVLFITNSVENLKSYIVLLYGETT